MTFIAHAPAPAPEPAEGTIQGDAFFPSIDLADLRATISLDGTVTTPRLRHAVTDAVISVGRELREWRQARVAEGHATLAEVPAAEAGGVSELLHLYRRAVYCLAKANIIERFPDFDATAKGDRKADTQERSIDDYRRDARWALADLRGDSRTTVELI